MVVPITHPLRRLGPTAKLRLKAATGAGTLASFASRLAGRGSGASIKGTLMLRLDPQALAKLLTGKRIAMVSGTNGKTTTTHLLAAAVRESLPDPRQLVHNADGANLHHGIASALSERPRRRHAVLETDERVVADVVRLGRPEVLVLLNFSRDQLDRHHEITSLGQSWRIALERAGERRPGRGGQRRRAADRLGRPDRPLGGLGRHRDGLDPGLVVVSPAAELSCCAISPTTSAARAAAGAAAAASWPNPQPTTGWSRTRSTAPTAA